MCTQAQNLKQLSFILTHLSSFTILPSQPHTTRQRLRPSDHLATSSVIFHLLFCLQFIASHPAPTPTSPTVKLLSFVHHFSSSNPTFSTHPSTSWPLAPCFRYDPRGTRPPSIVNTPRDQSTWRQEGEVRHHSSVKPGVITNYDFCRLWSRAGGVDSQGESVLQASILSNEVIFITVSSPTSTDCFSPRIPCLWCWYDSWELFQGFHG